MEHLSHWILFNIFVLFMLVLDLKVFQRDAHEIKIKEALWWSAFWIALAFAFNGLVYYWMGKQLAMEFFTGYVIERSLSIDNLFVFIIVFNYFGVPAKYQHRVLFWGILGALIFRAVFILAGVALIARFEYITYAFGALLIYTGVKLAIKQDDEMDPSKNFVLRLARHFLPIGKGEDGRFFVKDKRWMVTEMFVVLLVIETTDIVFAADSIPAILAVSAHPFIIYTSNVFAILGLRALYFALASVIHLFHYLNYGLSVVLVFIGVKMTITHFYKIPTGISLGVVMAILTLSVILSVLFPKKEIEKA